MMIGVCKCRHHRMDHDDGAYPRIGYCYICDCRKYSQLSRLESELEI